MQSEYHYLFFVNTCQTGLTSGCRRPKNANKYPYPRPPSNNEEMIIFNDVPRLNWSCVYVFDVWLLGLVAIETAKTPLGNLGWISADEKSTWYNALYYVALSLIRQYAVMSVNKKETKIFPIALDDLLRVVLTFSDRFAGLTAEHKFQLVIVYIPLDLAQAHLHVHKYDSDLEVELLPPQSTANSRTNTLPP